MKPVDYATTPDQAAGRKRQEEGWMEGWRDEGMDGWMKRWRDGWKEG